MKAGLGIEYDDGKSRASLAKHGLPPAAGALVISHSLHTEIDDSFDCGEDRFIDYGVVDGRVLVCVYATRGEVYRIISARKASRKEQGRWRP